MMDYTNLEESIERYVTQLMGTAREQYPYHNIEHIKAVVVIANILLKHYKINREDVFVVRVAAWFHDTGHAFGLLTGHEQKSVEIMQEYFEHVIIDNDMQEQIKACILATIMPANPGNLLEMILCDADTWHLGTTEFRKTDQKLKEEMELRLGKALENWRLNTLIFLKQHQYFTPFCKLRLNDGKKRNIEWLKSIEQ